MFEPLFILSTKLLLMKYKKRWGVTLFLVWGLLKLSSAQEVIPASGGEAFGVDGSIGYSVGQLFSTSHEAAQGLIFEGVHQPYEITVVTELPEMKNVELSLSVFPNPVSDFLYLTIDDFSKSENWFCRFYDAQGNLLYSDAVSECRKKIDLKPIEAGVYFLKVFNAEKGASETKTFKVLKK